MGAPAGGTGRAMPDPSDYDLLLEGHLAKIGNLRGGL